MAQKFTLHPQLKKDTHLLINSDDFFILLHKNATIPWIIIVPITNETEIFNLSDNKHKSINAITKQIAKYFEFEFSTTKMNIAAIGNMVPQLHIHIIGRKPNDECWPNVVWGSDLSLNMYTNEQIIKIRDNLQTLLL